jgi:hypothetical protein
MTPYLIFIAVPFVLLVGFLILVTYEARRGTRVLLAGRRYKFDLQVARISFILKHVDWSAFMNDVTRTGIDRMAHDVAHTTLMGVRALERQLTQVVRTLRARREQPLFPAPSADRPSRLQTTITYVKKTVQRSRKQPRPAQPESWAE